MVALDNRMVSAVFDPAASVLREETAEDEAFLRRLYASARAEEMARVPWPDEQKEAFLNMQFGLQRRHYQDRFPQAEFKLVLFGEMPMGRFYLDRSGDAFLLIDITLSPEYRGLGVGGHLLENLLAAARLASKPVRLHVETSSRAFRLYQRLGFSPVEIQGIRWLMEWQPN